MQVLRVHVAGLRVAGSHQVPVPGSERVVAVGPGVVVGLAPVAAIAGRVLPVPAEAEAGGRIRPRFVDVLHHVRIQRRTVERPAQKLDVDVGSAFSGRGRAIVRTVQFAGHRDVQFAAAGRRVQILKVAQTQRHLGGQTLDIDRHRIGERGLHRLGREVGCGHLRHVVRQRPVVGILLIGMAGGAHNELAGVVIHGPGHGRQHAVESLTGLETGRRIEHRHHVFGERRSRQAAQHDHRISVELDIAVSTDRIAAIPDTRLRNERLVGVIKVEFRIRNGILIRGAVFELVRITRRSACCRIGDANVQICRIARENRSFLRIGIILGACAQRCACRQSQE